MERYLSSGSTVVAISEEDTRARSMADAMYGAIGTDLEKLSQLIKALDAQSSGPCADVYVGQNDFGITVTSQ